MSLASFSVRRPIFTVMVTLSVITLGIVSLAKLRIDMLPPVEMPRLTISTGYEGADPEVMERLVTEPVEEIVATVPGVEEIRSASSEGNSRITVTFSWGTDIDAAAQDVRARLEDELNELPEDVVRPQIRKFDVNSFPVVILGIGSALDPVELTELVQKQVRYRFARIPGVAQVDMWGEYDREIRVEVDLDQVRALQLPLTTVLQRIREENVDLPAGSIHDGRQEIRLRAPAEFRNLEEIRKTVITTRDGAAVTLDQIATVRDTYTRLERISRINGKLGLRLGIRKQANANTVEVSEQILDEIEAVKRDYPQLEVIAVSNQGNFIERSIQNVANSVLYGGVLAVVVLLFFLRSLRSTMVISVAIPISIVATFVLIYFGGFTINMMTLGGLALGVGMMVDSSIVVLENIYRRQREGGEDIETASVKGTREVAGAIVASTITTSIVFLPLMFIEGVSGLLFRELAYVVVFSLVCSLLVALSLVPMLASRLVRDGEPSAGEGRTRGLAAWARGVLDSISLSYIGFLGAALRHRGLTVIVAVALTAASLVIIPWIGTEFMPAADESEVRVTGEMDVGTRLDLVDRQTRQLEDIVRAEVPEMEAYVSSVGSSGWRPGQGSTGSLQISLTPPAERERSSEKVAADLRQALDGAIPGVTVRTRAARGQFVLQRLFGTQDEGLTVEVRGFDLDILEKLGDRVLAAVRDVDGITDVDKSRKAGVPQNVIRIDREKAALAGVSVQQIARTLEAAVAGRQAGEFRPEGDSYRILVQLEDALGLDIDRVLDLSVETPAGESMPLRNLVTIDDGRGPMVIDRKDQQRIITITANVAGRDMGSVAAEVEKEIAAIPRPIGYEMALTGTTEEQRDAFGSLGVSLMLALLLVYMVLACQYESLRDPLVVMFSVPVAATGVLFTLWLTRTTLNIQSYIGCIMLGGIVVNNAILLVDQAGQLRTGGMAAVDAVREAGRRRLRPILMTTSTTILGLLPLAFGIGEGADTQAPLARAVIGGLLGSTVVTLVLIPAVYSLFHPERRAARTEQRGR